MKTVKAEKFSPDDDACNLTNPIDLKKWAKKNNLKLLYWSSNTNYAQGLMKLLDFSLIKYIKGSSFMVYRKKED